MMAIHRPYCDINKKLTCLEARAPVMVTRLLKPMASWKLKVKAE